LLSLHKVVESRLGYVVTPLLVTFLAVLIETLRIYSFVLIVRVLLSWFPNLDWSNPILSTVSSITDPYLNAFRGLIPPIGGIDLSAILAFVALNVMQWLLGNSIYAFSQLSMGL
tara:strand:- start:2643 stop:2984 length:342 start_codon:yes stop_codon:yes gene_type:complete